MADITIDGVVGAADAATQAFLSQTYPGLAAAVATPVTLLAIMYWALYGYRLFDGTEAFGWKDCLTRLVMTACVFATLNWGGAAQSIYQFFVSLMESTAATLMAGEPTAKMLDALWNNVGKVSTVLQNAGWQELGLILHGYGLFLLNCVLFMLALVYMTIAKFGLAITMVLLPLFVGLFFFPQTRQWAMNWLGMMLNFALIYILVNAIVRFGFTAFGNAIDEVAGAADALDAAAITARQIGYLYVIEGVLIIFMLQVKSWAAALAGGATVQSLSAVMMLARMAMLKR